MMVRICPVCFAPLERCRTNGKGRCPDCRYSYLLRECPVADRRVSGRDPRYEEAVL